MLVLLKEKVVSFDVIMRKIETRLHENKQKVSKNKNLNKEVINNEN
jgi:hypothetical protein